MDYYSTYYPTNDPAFHRSMAKKLRFMRKCEGDSVSLDHVLEEVATIFDYLAEENEDFRHDRD